MKPREVLSTITPPPPPHRLFLRAASHTSTDMEDLTAFKSKQGLENCASSFIYSSDITDAKWTVPDCTP